MNSASTHARLAIRHSVGCALIIPMIIPTIRRVASGPVWIDDTSNLSRPDPSGADQIDAEHQATELAVGVLINRLSEPGSRPEGPRRRFFEG
jgi:hypothetical protein